MLLWNPPRTPHRWPRSWGRVEPACPGDVCPSPYVPLASVRGLWQAGGGCGGPPRHPLAGHFCSFCISVCPEHLLDTDMRGGQWAPGWPCASVQGHQSLQHSPYYGEDVGRLHQLPEPGNPGQTSQRGAVGASPEGHVAGSGAGRHRGRCVCCSPQVSRRRWNPPRHSPRGYRAVSICSSSVCVWSGAGGPPLVVLSLLGWDMGFVCIVCGEREAAELQTLGFNHCPGFSMGLSR